MYTSPSFPLLTPIVLFPRFIMQAAKHLTPYVVEWQQQHGAPPAVPAAQVSQQANVAAQQAPAADAAAQPPAEDLPEDEPEIMPEDEAAAQEEDAAQYVQQNAAHQPLADAHALQPAAALAPLLENLLSLLHQREPD